MCGSKTQEKVQFMIDK